MIFDSLLFNLNSNGGTWSAVCMALGFETNNCKTYKLVGGMRPTEKLSFIVHWKKGSSLKDEIPNNPRTYYLLMNSKISITISLYNKQNSKQEFKVL